MPPQEVGKNEKNLKLKKKVSVSEKRISAPKPIPKFDLGFGCTLVASKLYKNKKINKFVQYICTQK